MLESAACNADPRGFWDRFWSRLGFGQCSAPTPEDLEGFAPSYLTIGTRIQFGWPDRVRVLVSGKVMVDINTKTDVLVGRCESVSSASVLPPSAKVRP